MGLIVVLFEYISFYAKAAFHELSYIFRSKLSKIEQKSRQTGKVRRPRKKERKNKLSILEIKKNKLITKLII
ncbi:MAG TPA: hypothetical protein VGB37_14165 [Candidatus Lokiarchaeia archaeon]